MRSTRRAKREWRSASRWCGGAISLTVPQSITITCGTVRTYVRRAMHDASVEVVRHDEAVVARASWPEGITTHDHMHVFTVVGRSKMQATFACPQPDSAVGAQGP